MVLKKIFSFLTYPSKGRPVSAPPNGAAIPLDDGKLCKMLREIFDNAGSHCTVPVIFKSDGPTQSNPVRTDLLALIARPTLSTVLPIATRLQSATSGTSGMGLMFVCIGDDGANSRVVISRFPADEGVVAERSAGALTVQFVEQVFLRSAFSYKAATYIAHSRPNDLWKGHVVDKQINHGSKAVADYWIVDFLQSDFATTAAAGTKRLAEALKNASEAAADLSVKQEIGAGVRLAANVPRRAMTIAEFCDAFHFSERTKQAVAAGVTPQRLVNEKFQFDAEEFARHIAFKQVELDTGAVLTAPAQKFDEIFRQTGRGTSRTFSTTGAVTNEKLKRAK